MIIPSLKKWSFVATHLKANKWLIVVLIAIAIYLALDVTIRPYLVKLMINNIPMLAM